MKTRAWRWGLLAFASATSCGLVGCGASVTVHRQAGAQTADQGANATGETPRLTTDPSDQVLGTLVIPLGRNGLSLASIGSTSPDADGNDHWVVDMEDKETVDAGVAPEKYLKVKGDLHVPAAAENKEYEIGCLFVDLKDNVYYREKTWLRVATTGITGKTYDDVTLPLAVDLGGWQPVPKLDDSVTIEQFHGNTIKQFHGTLCFKLDFSEAPAQEYVGQLIVQYLRPGESESPPACTAASKDPACAPRTHDCDKDHDDDDDDDQPKAPAFACASPAAVLKAGQKTTMTWTGLPAGAGMDVQLSTDSSAYKGPLGTVTTLSPGTVTYTAPASVPADARILVTARPTGDGTRNALPAFCQVQLAQDAAIGVPDDGEVQGLPGNVYVLPSGTEKLPDLSKLKAVDHIVASNLDVPNHSFSQGFPGVPNLIEWFAIQFHGELVIAQDTTCKFRLTADDGANLYLDGTKVVDDDGLHPVQSVDSAAVTLKHGTHDFRVDYYQGPRYYIALQLLWKCGNDKSFTIVPPSAFTRPLR